MNIELAIKILKACQENGVVEYCLCAGARNSPLVFLLAKATGVKIYHFFEERSAAFFAIGRMKFHHKPVAVVTTSGTAVAELLPAAVEATYSELPLVLLTADRPRRFRQTGAPQSIDQVGIFSRYVERCIDIESTEEDLNLDIWSGKHPLHLNVCFDEPLIDQSISVLNLSPAISKSFSPLKPTQQKKIQQPLIIVGGLKHFQIEAVYDFLKRKKIPVYAESNSGLRGRGDLGLINEKTAIDLIDNQIILKIIRLGGVPTTRIWRDLESKFKHLQVYSCADEEWQGLARSVNHQVGLVNIERFDIEEFSEKNWSEILIKNDFNQKKLINLLENYPSSEPGLIWNLSTRLKSQSIYLGNSLPIREWDLVSHGLKFEKIEANRGANGIDGQVSTFLGWAEGPSEFWAILGDLTTLYDLTGLWISSHLNQNKKRIIVVNNQGGQIFKNIFNEDAFLNSHHISFKHWASMWNWAYQSWQQIPTDIVGINENNLIVELTPDPIQTENFWKAYNSK